MYSGLSTCATFIPTGEIAGLMLNQILSRDTRYAFFKEDMSPYAREVVAMCFFFCHFSSRYSRYNVLWKEEQSLRKSKKSLRNFNI